MVPPPSGGGACYADTDLLQKQHNSELENELKKPLNYAVAEGNEYVDLPGGASGGGACASLSDSDYEEYEYDKNKLDYEDDR